MLRIWAYQCGMVCTRRGGRPCPPGRTHCRFYETLRRTRKCPTGGQRRPPLQKILRFCRTSCDFAIAFCAGGVEPLPYATVVDFADSHCRVPICNIVPHNPFVTASPCHLPLHKGGFGAVQTRYISERNTLLLIRRFAPPSPHGEGFGGYVPNCHSLQPVIDARRNIAQRIIHGASAVEQRCVNFLQRMDDRRVIAPELAPDLGQRQIRHFAN